MKTELFKQGGYSAGHPWYYLLGGARPTLKQIKTYAEARDYRGYMAGHIDSAAARPEPKRSACLRKIRQKVLKDLREDISVYRECARKLKQYRAETPEQDARPVCGDVHTSMSLKFAHINNGFAHLKTLEAIPAKQGDLFDF